MASAINQRRFGLKQPATSAWNATDILKEFVAHFALAPKPLNEGKTLVREGFFLIDEAFSFAREGQNLISKVFPSSHEGFSFVSEGPSFARQGFSFVDEGPNLVSEG